MSASLDLATGSETPMTSMPPSLQTSDAMGSAMSAMASAMATATPTSVAIQAAGDDAHAAPPSASATIMIVVGVVLGIVGVGSVITLIWWMRRRAMMRYQISTAFPPQQNFYYPPSPPPKERSMMSSVSPTSKALPPININGANSYRPNQNRSGRSNTAGSIDKDKALPIKPPESVWTSPTERVGKSPALASIHELGNKSSPRQPPLTPRMPRDEEAAIEGSGRMRSESVGSYKEPTAPANFL